ncbi:hypothetical protein NDN08_001830 [Rhodosorus marinus]|uniref:3-beta hydroxysteroid dehydrogenase/isomerase domain-containing protein n=1 Tax=Rhodosorus marinus TaxID=101924 RepID=A0AAV8UUS0_9RHOD|nr:hypothetical protein NDN08_001830 [Rhodosorus marinus]
MDGLKCVVTGGSGFVGWRLVEMLVERGAREVISFDISPQPEQAVPNPKVKFVQGDIRKKDVVDSVIQGADVVFHIAAVVGTFHPKKLYEEVNYDGTMNILEACKKFKVKRMVLSGTPSTRFHHGVGISGKGIEEMEMPKKFVAEYARTKAKAEIAVMNAITDDFLATCVMPHQVYGPYDTLFMPQLMYVSKKGILRVYGDGQNEISICYNDNYCHALMLAAEKLYAGSPVVGSSYIVTDGGKYKIWDLLDEASLYMGYGSIKEKQRIPYFVMMMIATISEFVSKLLGKVSRIQRFTVLMLMIDRWFDISAAERDLGYKPIKPTTEAWPETLQWFKEHEDFLIRKAQAAVEDVKKKKKRD